MSLSNIYKFHINNNDHFSLFKQSKKRIFGIYKTTRHSRQSKSTQKIIYSTFTNKYLKNLNISKEINLKFISPRDNDNNFSTKKVRIFNSEKLFHIKNNSLIQNKKKINDKKNFAFNENRLIRPILVDNKVNNNIGKQKFEKKSFNNYYGNIHNYNIYKNIFNQKINNKNKNKNNFNLYKNIFSNLKEIENNLKNKFETENTKNNTKSNSETKLKIPKFYQDEYFILNLSIPFNKNKNLYYNQNYNNFFEFNQFKLNEIKPYDNSLTQFKIEKNNYILEDKFNSSSSTVQEILNNNKEENSNENKNIQNIGRKSKNSNLNNESKHTKYSTDNMMRKIKNKVIESSRLLVNKILKDEYKKDGQKNFPFLEFHKIQGSFGQELNIKYNFWFYQITIKEIFCLEISNKYTATQKSSNKELIDFLFSDINNNKFIKTKKLLNTPFHQFYHDIFLGEDEEWKKFYGIKEEDNKFQIEYLLKNLEEENDEIIDEEKKYIKEINLLAHNYEKFFLEKKPRNLDYKSKKNEFIKTFMIKTLNNKYEKLAEEVKKYKEYYENRINLKNSTIQKNIFINDISFIIRKDSNEKNNEYGIKINKKSKNDNEINYANIDLKEEEKQGIIHEIKKNNKNENKKYINNISKINIENEKKKLFCNKKRGGEKIKYFISIKKPKRKEEIKTRFLVNKL